MDDLEERKLRTLERNIEEENYGGAVKNLAYIADNRKRLDLDEIGERRIEKAADELAGIVLQDSQRMLEEEENIYGNRAFYSEVEDLTDQIIEASEFVGPEDVERADSLQDKAYESAIDQKLQRAEEAYRRGLEDPSRGAAFSHAWSQVVGAESYAQELVTEDDHEKIKNLKEEISQQAPEFIYKHLLRDLEVQLYISDDFGRETEKLDTNQLRMANAYLEDVNEMLQYRGDEKLEDIQGFEISEVSEEADRVFWELSQILDERPFDVEEALENLQELGEKTGFYHLGIEEGMQRAEKMQTLQNNVNMAEDEIDQIYEKLQAREGHSREDMEEMDDLLEALVTPTDVEITHDIQRIEGLVEEVDQKIQEEPETEKEKEYAERNQEIREELSVLKRLV